MRVPLRVISVLCLQACLPLALCAQKLTPEDLVARHLQSIGTPAALAAIKSRVVQGNLTFKVMQGGSGEVHGTWGRVSEGRKMKFVMRFGVGDWRGEELVFDGNKTYVAAITNTHRKSIFGEFVQNQDYILKEGLLGGELSTGWALQYLDQDHPQLIYDGLKKVDGREVHDLEYHSRRSTDMRVHLYFDPETYHHVKTFYSIVLAPIVGRTVTESANQPTIRYTIEERFSDFKTTDGVTLPGTYSIEYTQEPQNGQTIVYHWDMTADRLGENVSLDPKNFDTK